MERDRAGNRKLFMDQYWALILLALFSPAVRSLRDRQQISALAKVRKRLGVTRASLGSLSESVALFDPARLICVAVEPQESSRGWKGPHCDGVLRLMVWHSLIDLASRKELEAFIRKRKQPALA